MEEYVARRFGETGFKVRRASAIYQNTAYPFMLANVDRLLVGERIGLECKTTSAYNADKWADGLIPLIMRYNAIIIWRLPGQLPGIWR